MVGAGSWLGGTQAPEQLLPCPSGLQVVICMCFGVWAHNSEKEHRPVVTLEEEAFIRGQSHGPGFYETCFPRHWGWVSEGEGVLATDRSPLHSRVLIQPFTSLRDDVTSSEYV